MTRASKLCGVGPCPLRVLLVDDDDIEQEGFRRALSRRELDTQLLIAGDGLEALRILRNAHVRASADSPLVVLLDLNMPRMTGLEFLSELRTDPLLQATVVYVLTTSNEERDRRASIDLEVAGYFVKGEVGDDYGPVFDQLERYAGAHG